MSIASNIKRFRVEKDWTQEQLAERVKVTRSTVTQWETGWSQPRMGALQKLADAFGVPISALVSDNAAPSPSPIPGALPVRPMKMVKVPLYGRVHAGVTEDPDVIEETEVDAPAFLAAKYPRLYGCIAVGDCMDKVYPEGCTVFVVPDKDAPNGAAIVASVDGEYIMRRVIRGASTLILAPDSYNPEHVDMVFTAGDENIVEIVGRIVWFQASREVS